MDPPIIISLISLFVSVGAVGWGYRQAVAAERSADAAEASNTHASRAAEEAIRSNDLAGRALRDEFKRAQGQAYWTLYRAHNRLLENSRFTSEGLNLSAIEDLLSVHGHSYEPDVRVLLRTALNGIDLALNFTPLGNSYENDPEYRALQDKIRPHVRDAAMALREEWYPIE